MLMNFFKNIQELKSSAKKNTDFKSNILPDIQKIGKLPKGRYLIGDLAKCLSIADETLVDEIKTLERFGSFDDFDEDEYLTIRIEYYIYYENKILEIQNIKKE